MTQFVKYFLIIYILITISPVNAQTNKLADAPAYKSGEVLKYRIHYGLINAGYATFKLKSAKKNNLDVFHSIGISRTTGPAKLFFDLNDRYESYFTKEANVKPLHFIRRVNENGYKIKRDLTFDHNTNQVIVDDLLKNTTEKYSVEKVQDMVSVLYYLRNINIEDIKPMDVVTINMFFDGETYPFKLRFEKREVLNTKFGKINTWRIQPMVQKGRFFEDQESLTIWLTDDTNHIPIRIKAALVVGSLKADLDYYFGLSNSLTSFKN